MSIIDKNGKNLWTQFCAIVLDWIDEYQQVDQTRLWEAVSGEGRTEKFLPDSQFRPRQYTNVIGESKMAASVIDTNQSDLRIEKNKSTGVQS